MKKIVLCYNGKSEDSRQMMERMAEHVEGLGAELVYYQGRPGYALDELEQGDFSGCEAAIVLGGDGTMLAASRTMAPLAIPLFGVNLGQVGFLSSAEPEQAFAAAERLLKGDHSISERLMLRCQLWREQELLLQCEAFNDFVVSGTSYTRAVNLDLYLNEQPVHHYSADGIIVSTPSGSTGYALSAGGPILMPDLELLLITPVCPHSFFGRPILARPEHQLAIVCHSRAGAAVLSADGQFRAALLPEDRLTVTAAPAKARIISFGETNFFERIKSKLHN